MKKASNLLLTDAMGIVDDTMCPPPTVRPGDLGSLLDLVATPLESGGVLALAGEWEDLLAWLRDCKGEVTTGEWSARVQPEDVWIRWQRTGGYVIWTVLPEALPVAGRSHPLIGETAQATAWNLHQWTKATDLPWVGTPGMTGNQLLIDRTPAPKQGTRAPRWNTPNEWTHGDIETPYSRAQWSREPGLPHIHSYDANMAYLSALLVLELPADDLTHHHAPPFDPKEGGIWRVQLERWHLENEMPDPAGYAPTLPDGSRWVTTQTLALVHALTEHGDHMGYKILESWTAPARRITRQLAEQLRDIITADTTTPTLQTAARRVYKETYGMWRRRGRVHRPDWHYATIAMARANLWRKMWRAHQQDMTPLYVETDDVYYDTAQPDWALAAPAGFPLDATGRKLGSFKPGAAEKETS
ncbi:hypothetical protein ACFRCW_42455 [Streptomyces sp. NPDC056653]|uniref:hypothetical protein n=1 Tax=Streptomyces sp. NPDC056653 TaxID=3345894 RepID=UPI0036A92A26